MLTDCPRVRTVLLSDPRADSDDLRLHLQSCAECARYAERLNEFEQRLGLALRVDLPGAGLPGSLDAPSATVVPFRPRAAGFNRPGLLAGRGTSRRGWLAAAASVALAVVVAGALWIGSPERSLAADVVGHMRLEPQAWAVTNDAVPEPALDRVLDESHLRLKAGAGLVSYAQSCGFRGHQVPHLVVQTDAGPITVMLLIHEKVSRRRSFDENGYRGILMPIPGHGGLAVLEKGGKAGMPDVDRVAAQVLGAIECTS